MTVLLMLRVMFVVLLVGVVAGLIAAAFAREPR